jgi:hypothetical protein
VSNEAVGYVFKYSPFSGATYCVHICVADSVNDQNDNKFWMRVNKTAKKARCSKRAAQYALHLLEEQGWLELLTALPGEERCYRFVFREGVPVQFDGRSPTGDPMQNLHGGGVQNLHGGGAAAARGGRNVSTPGGAEVAPRSQEGSQGNPRDAAEGPPPPPRVRAEVIVQRWWDAQEPKPVENFIGIVKIVERLLIAGWPEDGIAMALAHAPCVTVKTLVFELRTSGRGRSASGVTADDALAWLEEKEAEDG